MRVLRLRLVGGGGSTGMDTRVGFATPPTSERLLQLPLLLLLLLLLLHH